MPDPTNLEQIQEEKAQDALAAVKKRAIEDALMIFDPAYRFDSAGYDYVTLVDRLRTALDAELAALTAPPAPSAPAPSEG